MKELEIPDVTFLLNGTNEVVNLRLLYLATQCGVLTEYLSQRNGFQQLRERERERERGREREREGGKEREGGREGRREREGGKEGEEDS